MKQTTIKQTSFKKGGWLEIEILVDAKIILCAMRGGIDGIMEWGLRNNDIFRTTDDLMKRVNDIKKRPKMYIDAVSEKVAELELIYPGIIP